MKDWIVNNPKMVFFTSLWVALYAWIPLLGQDLWDGVIISHAFETRNREVVWNWFTESGWFLVPFMYDFFYFMFPPGMSLFAMTFAMIFFLFLAALEVVKIYERILGEGNYAGYFAGLIFLISPVWSSYFSTIFLMHSITLWIALFSLRNILCRGFKQALPFMALSLVSFQQASCGPLIISLLTFDILLNRKSQARNNLLKVGFYIVIALSYFFATRYAFPAHGLYTGYNQMDLKNLTSSGIYYHFKDFIFGIYPLLAVAPLFVFLSNNKRRFTWGVILLVAILLGNMLPFILVGKYPTFSSFVLMNGWNQRQAFTITVVLALLIAYVSSAAFTGKKYKSLIATAFLSVSLSISFVISTEAVAVKAKTGLLEKEMIRELSAFEELKNCFSTVELITGGSYGGRPVSYELNYIFYRAFNSQQVAIYKGARQPHIFPNPIYREKYIVPDSMPICKKQVRIESVVDNLSIWEAMKLIFGWKVSSQLVKVEILDV